MGYEHIRRSGGAQLVFGILSVLIGITLVCLWAIPVANTNRSTSSSQAVGIALGIAFLASPLFCGWLYIVAGSIGCCATERRSNSMGCIRACVIIFSVLSSLAACVQTGLCGWYGYALSYPAMNNGDSYYTALFALTVVGGVIGLLEMVTAIVAASIGCCCPGEAQNETVQYTMK